MLARRAQARLIPRGIMRAHSTLATPTLRPYQQACIDATLTKLRVGVRKQIASLPVGSGKTVVLANLLRSVPVPEGVPTATKTLVCWLQSRVYDVYPFAVALL